MEGAPEDLHFFGGINFLVLHRGDNGFWRLSVEKVVTGAGLQMKPV